MTSGVMCISKPQDTQQVLDRGEEEEEVVVVEEGEEEEEEEE